MTKYHISSCPCFMRFSIDSIKRVFADSKKISGHCGTELHFKMRSRCTVHFCTLICIESRNAVRLNTAKKVRALCKLSCMADCTPDIQFTVVRGFALGHKMSCACILQKWLGQSKMNSRFIVHCCWRIYIEARNPHCITSLLYLLRCVPWFNTSRVVMTCPVTTAIL